MFSEVSMFKRSLISAALLLSATTAMAVPYGFSDARSVAMGNTSIATGGVTTAAFSNPAMLMINESNDAVAIHVGVGLVILEDGDIIDDIEGFQDAEEEIDALINNLTPANEIASAAQATVLVNQQIDVFNNDLAGDSLVGRASPNVAIIFGGDSFAFAVTAEANGYGSAAIVSTTPIPLINPLTVSQLQADNFQPDLTIRVQGAVTQELGLSIASDFSIMGMDVSVGVKPKLISAEAVNFTQSLQTFDEQEVLDTTAQDLGSTTTLDAGLVISLTDSLRAGVVVKNLLSDTLRSGAVSFDIDTQIRAGVAYSGGFFTLAADMDITEGDPIDVEDGSKMMAVGVEFNVFDIVQLRGGYQTNMAGGASADDLLSAGVGIWLGFNLDVAAVVSESSVGVFLQTGFRF
jgi:hypothetical protein